MKLGKLLEKLGELDIKVESRTDDGRFTAYTLHGKLPSFPHGSKPVWYTLVVANGQDDVSREEIEAIQRRFWQLQADLET